MLGVRDLFWLPIEQYRRDGRIVRGLQRGGRSFMMNTTLSCLELSKDLLLVINKASETCYIMVSPVRSQRRPPTFRVKPPAGFGEGIGNALTIVKHVRQISSCRNSC